MGLDEVEKHRRRRPLSQLVVLTDGETSGEQTCRQLAQQAAEKKIHFTSSASAPTGTRASSRTWPSSAEGKWGYIDVNEATAAERVFVEEFEQPGRRRLPRTSRCTCGR